MDAMGIELEEQPAVWARLWDRRAEIAELVAQVAERRLQRVIFTGCGDCHAAAEYGEAVLALRSELSVRGLPAMELARFRNYLLDRDTLLVAMSVSGRTPRVLEAVRAAKKRGARVLALTDDPSGLLAEEVGTRFFLRSAPASVLESTEDSAPEATRYAGYHRAVPQTKTFGAMQLSLATLCLELAGLRPSGRSVRPEEITRSLSELPQLASTAERTARRAAQLLATNARGRARVTFCGTGLHGSTARFAAYKLLELTCEAAHSDVEEFCHTRYLITGEGDVTVFFAHDPRTLERAGEIIPTLQDEIGAAVAALVTSPAPHPAMPWIAAIPPVPPEVSPILLSFAAAHVVRDLARAWGINTDRFRAGMDEERYVRGSTRIIRESKILDV